MSKRKEASSSEPTSPRIAAASHESTLQQNKRQKVHESDPTSMPAAFGCASPDIHPVPPAVIIPLTSLPHERKVRQVKILNYYVELSELEWRIVDTPHFAAKRKVGGTCAARSQALTHFPLPPRKLCYRLLEQP
jgi:hypothetical protein